MIDIPFLFKCSDNTKKQFVYNGKSFYITEEEFNISKEQGISEGAVITYVFQLLTQRNLSDFSHIPEHLTERLH
jgi:hypothetical protein